MTVQDYTNRWSERVLVLKSRASADNIASRLRLLNSFIGSLEINCLDHSSIQDLFTKLAGQYSPQSLRSYWGALHGLLVSARQDRLVKEIPEAPQMPRVRLTSKPWYTAGEMRALIGHSPHPLNGLLALLAETGIRIGEALALDTNSIRGGLLTVDKNLYRGKPGPPKTDTSYRSLSLSGHLAESLAMLSERQGAILFRNSNDHYLWPGDVAGVMRDKVALSAQLEWRGFHAFRRGNVSLMRQLGVSPTIRLYREGHSPKGNFLEARYDQNIGLTPLERQEEKQWAEKIGQEIQGDQENG